MTRLVAIVVVVAAVVAYLYSADVEPARTNERSSPAVVQYDIAAESPYAGEAEMICVAQTLRVFEEERSLIGQVAPLRVATWAELAVDLCVRD